MILVDTDIMIDLLRQYQPATEWLYSLAEDERVVLPGYVVRELVQGCRDKAEQYRLHRVLSNFSIIWPAAENCDQAVATYYKFHLSHNAGLLDVLIAHTALGHDLLLYTFNNKHYSFLKKLHTIQPYPKS